MARKLRLEYPGTIYHVMNRGDRRRVLETLGQACAKTGWQVHAWCLMDNHFHLVVETWQPNLVAGMKWFPGTYTGRYKSLVVDGSGNGYLRIVCDYVQILSDTKNRIRLDALSEDSNEGISCLY